MKIGHRADSKNFTIPVSVKDGWFRLSLRTSDPNEAAMRAREVEKLAQAGLLMHEIKARITWLPVRPKAVEKALDLTFNELSEKVSAYWKEVNRSFEGYHKQRLIPLKAHFGVRRIRDITPEEVMTYQRLRKKDMSPASINRELAVLKTAFNLAIQWGLTTRNPVKGVKLFKEPRHLRYLSMEEIEKCMSVCTGWFRPIFFTLILTGMRIGELLALRWVHVDFTRNVLKLEKTKTDEPREIPLSQTVRDLLWEMSSGQGREGLVFHTSNGTAYQRRNIRRALKLLLDLAKVNHARVHDLRHTFASQFMMGGGNLYTLSKLLGHKSVRTTEIYAHLAFGHQQEAMNTFEGYLTQGIAQRQEVAQKLHGQVLSQNHT